MSINWCKQTITNYSLDNCDRGNQGYQRVLLQLFGLPGNGKSSFINSCKFVIDGFYKEHAKARETDGGCTTKRVPYDLTNVIMMVDNRGFPTLNKFETGEVFAQLGNLLPLDEEVEWVADYEKNVDRLMEENPNYTDFIVPILVHSVKNVIPREEVALYKEILKTARELTGINPLVLLTHKSHGGLTAQEVAFRDMGADKIYAIENYTEEDQQKVLGKHEEILKLLCQVLNEVDFCMEKERDPIRERKERMKFILKYIKKADAEKIQRELMAEAAKHEREMNKKHEREIRESEAREREARERETREREAREREQSKKSGGNFFQRLFSF